MSSVDPSALSEVKVTDRFDLSNKNFLITGGGRGIGFACAKAIAQLGGGIAVIDIATEPVEEFHSLQARYNVKTFYTQGDVTDQASLESAFARSLHAMGQLHGGLTAAGIVGDTPLLEADWELTQRTLNVNVLGTYWTMKLLAQHLVESKNQGSIVAISSVNGQGFYVPVQPQSAYNASKAAVKGLVGPLAGNSVSMGFESTVSHRAPL